MIIINRLKEQVENSKKLSDSETFLSLIRLGEFFTKVVTLATISALKDNKQRTQYKHLYSAVSADGIGSWAYILEQILGTAVVINIKREFNTEKNELIKAQGQDEWGLKIIYDIYECKKLITKQSIDFNVKVKLKDWFKIFSELRNDYAHNRISLPNYSSILPYLERSIYTFIENFNLFRRPWIFVHRLSTGKLRLLNLNNLDFNQDILIPKFESFEKEGVYVVLDNNEVLLIPLLITDVRLLDFYLPNGRFTDKKFELISYISSETISMPSDEFLLPIERLPKSETHGLEQLELINSTFTNLPKLDRTYVERSDIEEKLYEALLDSKKWRIITLRGRGGIGKTSTALEVLKKIIEIDRYDAILWFSARDIDFDEHGGPITVEQRILTKEDISNEYAQLIEHPEKGKKNFNANEYFTQQLENNFFGKTLFVFDNFETVERPLEIYDWLENFIVLPNKILITTRHREFSTDKPIEVEGMKYEEFKQLVLIVAADLKIDGLITDGLMHKLYTISLGHPYVVKILLGEIANTKSVSNLNKVFENKDQILQALFERTYDSLKPLSQKMFQILCNWRSIIPEIALEATVICHPMVEEELEGFDVMDAIDELRRFSFIEILNPKDEFRFINVPLTASFFGITKLKVNPNKSLVQAYTKLLQEFGASQLIHINEGIEPRFKYFFSTIKQKVNSIEEFNENYLNIVQFICRRYPKAWLFLVEVYEILKQRDKLKKCYKEYLRAETNEEAKEVYWDRLANLYSESGKIDHYYQTKIDKYDYRECSLNKLTNLAHELSKAIRNKEFTNVRNDIRYEMLKRLITLIENNSEYPKIAPSQLARLAWLYIHLGQPENANKIAEKGLTLDWTNAACSEIKKKIGKAGSSNS